MRPVRVVHEHVHPSIRVARGLAPHDLGRAGDGRGPLFWAYEFKNVDSLALLMHLGVEMTMEDLDGKEASTFFPGDEATRKEFEADAKSKMGELATLLSAWAAHHGTSAGDAGYCQGMSFVAAMLLRAGLDGRAACVDSERRRKG